MASNLKIKRGLKSNLPSSANAGEPLYTMDTKEFFIGNGTGEALSLISGGGVKVGSSGTPDYLNESYFEQDSTNHIRIKQSSLLTGINSDLLDGQHGSYYLNYNNLTNKPTSSTVAVDDAVDKKHIQNTDTGTVNTIFQLDTGNSGPKLKHNSGKVEVRNSADSDYEDVVCKNLIVHGTTTTIHSETVTIDDNIVVLNSNYTGATPTENGGIEVERGTQTNASLIWDESNDKWKAGLVGNETAISLEGHNHDSSYVNVSGDTVQNYLEVNGSFYTGQIYSAGSVEFNNDSIYIAKDIDPSNVRSVRLTTNNNSGYIGLSIDSIGHTAKANKPSTGGLVQNIMYLNGSTGYVGLGSQAPSTRLHVEGSGSTSDTNPLANAGNVLRIVDTRTYGSNVGGQIELNGKYDSSGNNTVFGTIAGVKLNSTDGDYSGRLDFYVRKNGVNDHTDDQAMVITKDKFVGVGHNAPLSALHVKTGVEASSVARFRNTNATSKHTFLQLEDSTGGLCDGLIGLNTVAGTVAGSYMYLGYNAYDQFVIANGGYIGIGTTSPSSKVTIKGDTNDANTALRIENYNTNSNSLAHLNISCKDADNTVRTWYLGAGSSGLLDTRTKQNYLGIWNTTDYTSPKFTFTLDGKMGVGTSDPARGLHIVKNGSPAIRLVSTNSNQGIEMSGATGKYNFLLGLQYNADNSFEITPSTAADGFTFTTPAFLVKSNGNVGINNTNPSEKLEVNGKIKTNNQIVSTLATGTSPLSIDSTTLVSNLNADLIDGKHAGTSANNVLVLDGSGLVPLGNIPTTLTGKDADTVDGKNVDDNQTSNAYLWTASKIINYISSFKFRTY